MTARLITGNQAVALGALRAGVKVVTGYPGTPSTGCLTHLLTLDLPDRHVEWSTNEKVAFEIAAGAAWAGHRAMCTMKMSGVNVAYDALISIAYSGTQGGLVIYGADDPGASAGMAEQDSRGFALMSDLPMLEPASPSEAYALAQAAFELSEAVGGPVFLRLTTATALSHCAVEVEDPIPPKTAKVVLEKDITRYTKAGSKICIDQHRALIDRLERTGEWVHERGLNRLDLSGEPDGLGIIASGAVNAYLHEAIVLAKGEYGDRSRASMLDSPSILRAVTTIPFPREEVKQLLEHCGTILVLEELEPHMERDAHVVARHVGFDGPIIGKIEGSLSRTGEIATSEILRGLEAALGTAVPSGVPVRVGEWQEAVLPSNDQEVSSSPTQESPLAILESTDGDDSGLGAGIHPAPRPITVCAGCPHRGTYLGIEAAIAEAGLSKDEVMVTGDIGCTILGMNPPFDLLWTEVSMGSSVSLAQGYVHAGIETPVIATIGDSTFFHGGIPGLINAIQHKTPLTLVILDNGWTSMTGMQVNPGTDQSFQTAGSRRIDLVKVVEGLGPDSITVVDPYDVKSVTEAVGATLGNPGVHVVIAQRECAIQARRRGVVASVTTVDPELCILCKKCLRVTGCPALSLPKAETPSEKSPGGDSPGGGAIEIDSSLCNGCGICSDVCPTGALGTSRADARKLLGEESAPDSSPGSDEVAR